MHFRWCARIRASSFSVRFFIQLIRSIMSRRLVSRSGQSGFSPPAGQFSSGATHWLMRLIRFTSGVMSGSSLGAIDKCVHKTRKRPRPWISGELLTFFHFAPWCIAAGSRFMPVQCLAACLRHRSRVGVFIDDIINLHAHLYATIMDFGELHQGVPDINSCHLRAE